MPFRPRTTRRGQRARGRRGMSRWAPASVAAASLSRPGTLRGRQRRRRPSWRELPGIAARSMIGAGCCDVLERAAELSAELEGRPIAPLETDFASLRRHFAPLEPDFAGLRRHFARVQTPPGPDRRRCPSQGSAPPAQELPFSRPKPASSPKRVVSQPCEDRSEACEHAPHPCDDALEARDVGSEPCEVDS
jgi:hypothetical protein